MKKVFAISFTALLVLAATVIAGDYYGFWGQVLISKTEIENIRFRAAEKESGTPVIDYHIRCSAQGSTGICSTAEYRSSPLGEKTVKVGVNRTYRKGLIFSHPVAGDAKTPATIRIWVLHPEYHGLTLDISPAELLGHSVEPVQLLLQPRYPEVVPGSN